MKTGTIVGIILSTTAAVLATVAVVSKIKRKSEEAFCNCKLSGTDDCCSADDFCDCDDEPCCEAVSQPCTTDDEEEDCDLSEPEEPEVTTTSAETPDDEDEEV